MLFQVFYFNFFKSQITRNTRQYKLARWVNTLHNENLQYQGTLFDRKIPFFSPLIFFPPFPFGEGNKSTVWSKLCLMQNSTIPLCCVSWSKRLWRFLWSLYIICSIVLDNLNLSKNIAVLSVLWSRKMANKMLCYNIYFLVVILKTLKIQVTCLV